MPHEPFFVMSFLNDHPYVEIIQQIARRKKVSVYLVGGFLRDYLLGHPKFDFDFAVEKDALKLARLFARRIKGAFVLLDAERGCGRVVKKYQGQITTFDFADFRASTFKGDIAHRDFTINTLAVDLSRLYPSAEIPQALIDHKGALKDIKAKCIRQVSAKVFAEDPLRMMRAFTLKAALGFKIERRTLAQMKKDKDLLPGVSYERIRDELFKILGAERAADNLKAMDMAGLLEKVIPQIKVMYRCRQGTYHHLDVWPHSLETVVQIERIFKELRQDKDVMDYCQESLGGDRRRQALLKLAALLHDIGKPDTCRREGTRVVFHAHERVGRDIVSHIAKMLKLSRRERYALEDMVLWHLRPGYLSNFKKPSERAVYRYFRDAKEEAVGILLLSLADQRATRGPLTTEEDQRHHEKVCLGLIQRYFDKKKEKPFACLINGHDLIKKLRLKPSPLFGRILKEVAEKQSLGSIQTKDEALELARKIAQKNPAMQSVRGSGRRTGEQRQDGGDLANPV
jgi:poly(A) polymerase